MAISKSLIDSRSFIEPAVAQLVRSISEDDGKRMSLGWNVVIREKGRETCGFYIFPDNDFFAFNYISKRHTPRCYFLQTIIGSAEEHLVDSLDFDTLYEVFSASTSTANLVFSRGL